MLIIRRQSMAVIAALFLTLQTAAAQTYHYPLHSEAIRDAYFLGERNNFQTTDCLLQYIHRFTRPQAGRYYISQVDISTPYQQIVLRGQRDTPGDSEVQTETDLQAQPEKFVVEVQVELNGAYADQVRSSVVSPPDFSHLVSIRVAQESDITPLTTTRRAVYTSMGRTSVFVGWLLKLQFDPAKVTSAPLRISVKTPDGQVEEAKFDMAKIQ
jgi:hypothetical protein